MSHFAKVENGIVTQLIVASQDEINTENHGDAFLWVQCSYNNKFRGQYPGVGYSYDKELDAFIPPKLYESWNLNIVNKKHVWEPPVDEPEIDDPLTESSPVYTWNEEDQQWQENN